MSKILIFGDSYARPFKFFKVTDNIIANIFSGKTAKGLLYNEVGQRIISVCNTYKNNIKCIIMMFGQCDVHISKYYEYAVKDNVDFDYNTVFENYVEFIKKLTPYTANIYVINVLPNTGKISTWHIALSAIFIDRKMPLDIKQVNKLKDIISSKKFMLSLRIANNILKRKLQRLGPKVTFLEMNQHMFIDFDNYKIDPLYFPYNVYDFHLPWESFIWLLVNKYNTCVKTKDFPTLQNMLTLSENGMREHAKKLADEWHPGEYRQLDWQ